MVSLRNLILYCPKYIVLSGLIREGKEREGKRKNIIRSKNEVKIVSIKL